MTPKIPWNKGLVGCKGGAKKGSIPWNKGKKGYQVSWSKGKKLPQRSGEKSPLWQGGRFIAGGYVWIYAPNHPRVIKNKSPYIAEHILVIEKHVRRYLKPDEVVHHINGAGTDNRIENLRLMTRAKHLRLHKPRGW